MGKVERYACLRLENQFCFPLYACAKEIVRRYRKPLESLHLTYTQYLVMMVLWEHGEMTESELGEKIYLDSGTLAPLLKRLEKLGYLTRDRSDRNERTLRLALTQAGQSLKEQALRVPQVIEGCIDLPDDELRQLKQLLEKALSQMNNKGKETL